MQAAAYSGIQPDETQIELMDRYRTWLASEGFEAGGVGTNDSELLDRRHLGDSLLFAAHFPQDSSTVWDLGSGVGLPGIPLAICLPDTEFVMIDRSGKRCQLLRRVIRILDLSNCHVVQTDIVDLDGLVDVIVSRASLPPHELGVVVKEHLNPEGVAVVAGSWRKRPRFTEWTTIEIPPDALDQTIWLLNMRRQ